MSATQIWYLLIDQTNLALGHPFYVDIPSDAKVEDLRKRIKEENAVELAHVDANDLNVWRLRDPPTVNSVSRTKDLERFLSITSQHLSCDKESNSMTENETPVRLLYYVDVISKLGDWPGEKLHIIVQLPVEHKRRRDEEEKAIERDLSPPAVKLLKTAVGKAAPSSLARPSQFRKTAEPEQTIHCNCVFENSIPLVLYHQAFGIFKDRCEEAPSEQAIACLEELADVACERHETEAIRRSAIQSVLEKYTGLALHEQNVPGTEFTIGASGSLIVIVMSAAIRECKIKHRDPLFEALSHYSRFLDKALEDPRRYHDCTTRFPSILIVDMGFFWGFYGAVWDGARMKIEPLTPNLDMSTHWRQTKARHAIASSLDALIVAVRNIQAHYDVVKAEAESWPRIVYFPGLQKARAHPFLTSYDDNGQERTFWYDTWLDGEKLVFSATLNHNFDKCIVKFTRQYSEAVHNYLYSRGSAPRLRQCVRISAEWTAVIMDKSKYYVLYNLGLSKADQEKVRRKVKNEVQMLHNEGFVHGDIRSTNLLVDISSLASDEVVIHFIDFDWAGRIGEARYPMGVNKKTVKRAEGTKSGGLITKRHDEDMILYLFK